ncbi:diacylglycerol kinase family lipid kinase [bacterium]|nr:diacylglycerol kinase family lipid kinase [bacterium]
MNRKWFVVINPASNRGSGSKCEPEIRHWLDRQKIDHDVLVTTQSSEALPYVIEKTYSHDVIVAAGGDGTVHEVINGMMQARVKNGKTDNMAALGVLPIGSGNDFVKMINIPVHLQKAFNILEQKKIMSVDVGQISVDGNHTRFFNNNIGVGFDAYVNYESIKIKHLRGVAIYLTAVLKSLFKYKPPFMRVDIGGEKFSRNILMLTIGNGKCSGGGFYITPNAKIDDGFFDVCAIDAMGKGRMLSSLVKVMKGAHLNVAGVMLRRATEVEIHSDEALPIHADGEVVTLDAHEIKLKIIPSALQVIHGNHIAL